MVNEEKEMTEVYIITSNYRIHGMIALVPGARLTDYIDEAHHFIAVTDATLQDRITGEEVLKSKFMDVNRENVEIILPANLASWSGKNTAE